jgi:uncharacterized RDD family membrane protein YckC
MPVKVKCRECGKVATAPDAARGKTVKCKDCGEPIKIPSGEGGGAAKKATEKKAASIDDEDFFGKLDLEAVEDEKKRICPKCASVVTDEDIECPSCGVNLETGLVSDKQKAKRKYIAQGRDPDQFFKQAWSDPLAFLKANIGLCFRLAFSVGFASSLATCCGYITTNYFEKVPLKVFFGGIGVISFLATIGTVAQLYNYVVKQALDTKDDMSRFNFDFFAGVALGLKLLVWPVAVMGPGVIGFSVLGGVLGALGVFDPASDDGRFICQIVGSIIYLIGGASFPIAMTHMSSKFTYKAYLPGEMFRLLGKNISAVGFWWLIVVGINLPVLLASAAIGYFNQDVLDQMRAAIYYVLEMGGISTKESDQGFLFALGVAFCGLVLMTLLNSVVALLGCFPTVFATRLTGIFGYHNAPKLALGDRRVAGNPAGFWLRYLAFLIDGIVIFCFVVGAKVGVDLFAMFLGELGVEGMDASLQGLSYLIQGLIPFGYYALSESGPGGTTLGKSAMGLIVVNKEGKKPITISEAMMRFVLRVIGLIPFAAGLLMALWDKDQQTLQDKVTKTKVVFRPDFT